MPRVLDLTVLALIVPAAAFAQERDPETGREIRWAERTELDMTDPVEIEGTLVGPDGVAVSEARHKGFNPLIELRTDFDTEMVQSVDEVE